MPDPLPTPRKIFDLEGEAQVNADGTSRQVELRRCLPGEPVELRRERDNPADPDRITVLSARGVPIGRLTRQYAALLGPLLESGRPHRAKLHCLRGGLAGYPNYGARISIAWDGRRELRHRPLDEEQTRYRQGRLRDKGSQSSRPGAVMSPQPSIMASAAIRTGDRDVRLLTLIGMMLLLAAIAFYKLAALIASACWACG